MKESSTSSSHGRARLSGRLLHGAPGRWKLKPKRTRYTFVHNLSLLTLYANLVIFVIYWTFKTWKHVLVWYFKNPLFWKAPINISGVEQIKLEASTDSPGCRLRAPTLEGFVPLCTDTFDGKLKLQLWERNADGTLGKVSSNNPTSSAMYYLHYPLPCHPTFVNRIQIINLWVKFSLINVDTVQTLGNHKHNVSSNTPTS